jgi:flagellar hook assembly protein FlgD
MVTARDYKIEIDTSYLFNSSLKIGTVINGGAIVKWKDVGLPLLQDSLVYYWRVRFNTLELGEDTLWGESSFIYINGSPEGWSQSEFPQFFKDGLSLIERNIPERKWEFSTTTTSVAIRTAGTSYIPPQGDPLFDTYLEQTLVRVNGVNYEFRGWCLENSLLAAAIDKNTGKIYTPYPSGSGGENCGVSGFEKLNYFNTLYDAASPANPSGAGAQNQANLIEFINSVKPGDYVLMLNHGNAFFSDWSTTLKDKFKNELGADSIDLLASGMPYILLAQKGNVDPVFEDYEPSSGFLYVEKDLVGTSPKGYVTSTLIGPSTDWGTLYRTFRPSELPLTDHFELKIIGVDINGHNSDTLSIAQIDTLALTTVAGLDQYPYIRLLAEIEDSLNLTPYQLEKWQVIYSSVPEGTMNPALIGIASYNSVTKAEGDSISVCYAFENISDKDFTDTLVVQYTITNPVKGIKTETAKLKPLKIDSIVYFCHKFSTKGLEGSNVLQAFVNPKIIKEQYYNNNIVEMSFTVIRDKIHPVLDVVFDGTHIMDGDIVSPNPLITITLNDENLKLIRTNPDGIEIFIQSPKDNVPQSIDILSSDIVSAQQIGGSNKNTFQIEYHPKNMPDGVYTLVVRAKDVAGNTSGVEDYRIKFEVINESSITNFYPYPNPFSSSTRFVFTLTGSDVPSDLKIQIMTVTGKVVREITKSEIGPIRIGNNKTEYAWDGTDEFGDKLANGVYLYRVIIKDAGSFKHRDTAGDKAFHKNFGKLYILR